MSRGKVDKKVDRRRSEGKAMTSASYQGRGEREVIRPQPKAPQVSDVAPFRLIVRCLIEKKGDQWQGFTLEFGLAVQADTLPEVKRKLESMVHCYVRDALIGEDREHAYDLLVRRKATWQVYLRYYLFWIASRFAKPPAAGSNSGMIYRAPLALEPCHCPA
jgi:hypothetical protein